MSLQPAVWGCSRVLGCQAVLLWVPPPGATGFGRVSC